MQIECILWNNWLDFIKNVNVIKGAKKKKLLNYSRLTETEETGQLYGTCDPGLNLRSKRKATKILGKLEYGAYMREYIASM